MIAGLDGIYTRLPGRAHGLQCQRAAIALFCVVSTDRCDGWPVIR